MEHNRVIALGFFDGVHRGHGALLQKARQRAGALSCRAAALTFDAHPDTVVFGQPVELINTMEDRKYLMTQLYGLDEVLVAHFDRAMASMPWETFVEDVLIRQLGARHVVCGHDFSFGAKGQGNPQRLTEKCAQWGVGCDVIGRVEYGGFPISSTHIRQLIHQGSMEEAALLLGHPHLLTGVVTHGKELGRRLGIPTANLPLPEGLLAPAFGVYATKVFLPDGSQWTAVTNVGVRPTVHDSLGPMVEPWLLDYNGDLYGQTIRIEFYRQLRPEQKFASLDQLKAEILKNANQTRAYFHAAREIGI
ncbi:MAG: riboflavin biosynthesis protein RibF [Candidatus Avoscillospira sp.]